MAEPTGHTFYDVINGLEANLRAVHDFVQDKIVDHIEDKVVGPALGVVRKASKYPDLVLDYFGIEETHPFRQHLRETRIDLENGPLHGAKMFEQPPAPAPAPDGPQPEPAPAPDPPAIERSFDP